MALETSRDRGTENEKRAVDDIMERGNFMLQEVPVETSSRYVSIQYEQFLLYVRVLVSDLHTRVFGL